MLASQRHAYILERIRAEGGVRVADLVRALSVSDMTVRRDLEWLDEQGLLKKVHGGATAVDGASLVELAFTAKAGLETQAKKAIAEVAAALVQPGQAIGISAGTTTYEVARQLLDVPRLTVVTNSVPVADIFHHAGRPDQTVILTGGVRTPSNALVGPVAVTALRSLHVDLVLMGIHGMDGRAGFTTPNMLEAETDIALIEAGRRLVVVADHTKWGIIGVSSIGKLSRADTLITDDRLAPETREEISALVGELVVVPTAGSMGGDGDRPSGPGEGDGARRRDESVPLEASSQSR